MHDRRDFTQCHNLLEGLAQDNGGDKTETWKILVGR